MVTFEDQLKNSEILIKRWNGKANGKINIAMMLPTPHPEKKHFSRQQLEDLKYRSQASRALSKKYKLLFTMDGHSRGTIKFTHEKLNSLGPDALLSHCTDITAEEIRICKLTDTKIVHNVNSTNSIMGRCPVPELIDAGVTVMLGSDAEGPNISYDMFRNMFHCMHYHRIYYHDFRYMPPGKILEMVTIDSARALGLEKELGSLEPGKKADIILLDTFKPHIYPLNMLVDRVTCYANGNDVDTVIVDGEILMENRSVKTVDEAETLNMAQTEIETALDRTNFRHLLQPPERYWGRSKLAY
jgi:cytosine/adenosine deaminase-related metal-dependent hydrolase